METKEISEMLVFNSTLIWPEMILHQLLSPLLKEVIQLLAADTSTYNTPDEHSQLPDVSLSSDMTSGI
jgi:hypothetical protein